MNVKKFYNLLNKEEFYLSLKFLLDDNNLNKNNFIIFSDGSGGNINNNTCWASSILYSFEKNQYLTFSKVRIKGTFYEAEIKALKESINIANKIKRRKIYIFIDNLSIYNILYNNKEANINSHMIQIDNIRNKLSKMKNVKVIKVDRYFVKPADILCKI